MQCAVLGPEGDVVGDAVHEAAADDDDACVRLCSKAACGAAAHGTAAGGAAVEGVALPVAALKPTTEWAKIRIKEQQALACAEGAAGWCRCHDMPNCYAMPKVPPPGVPYEDASDRVCPAGGSGE